jgi:hypothetical protein
VDPVAVAAPAPAPAAAPAFPLPPLAGLDELLAFFEDMLLVPTPDNSFCGSMQCIPLSLLEKKEKNKEITFFLSKKVCLYVKKERVFGDLPCMVEWPCSFGVSRGE